MSSKKMNYISYGQSVDGTNYCSGVETLAENLIEDNENDAVIVFPSKTGWASIRSDEYRMTTDNAEMILPVPIYKVRKIWLKVPDFKIYQTDSFGSVAFKQPISDFKDENGKSFLVEFDISDYVLPEDKWKSLLIADKYTSSGHYKNNTLYWQVGAKSIPFLGTVYKIGWNISGSLGEDPVYMTILRTLIIKYGSGYKGRAEDDNANIGGSIDLALYVSTRPIKFKTDVRDWQFRIEYVPMGTKTKLRARKNEKTNIEYMQPHNQRAEINAVSAFGKNMWLTAQKTGTRTVTVVKKYRWLSDIPPVGALVRHNGKRYRIVANSYLQTNIFYMQVTHTLSENWTSRSKHVSVDQKYRNYNIPQDILWRNLYWEDYVTVSGDQKTINQTENAGLQMRPIMRLFWCTTEYDSTIDTFCWFFDTQDGNGNTIISTVDQGIGVALPCSTYGTANSMVFSASFKDQLSAGLRMNIAAENEDYLCEEALYCSTNGKLTAATVVLSDGLYSENGSQGTSTTEGIDYFAREVYPVITDGETPFADVALYIKANYPKQELFSKKFYIDKDPGEALKFTYQVHFITEGDCVVGNKLAEHNPLVKRYETGRTLKVWLLKSYLREGADKMENPIGTEYIATTETERGDLFTISADGAYHASIHLRNAILQALRADSTYKAWAITDENDNLYVGRNGDITGKVYFCISHKRP